MSDTAGTGLRAVLLSIAVAGVLGYVIQLSVPALTDEQTYIGFAVFWSALYLGGSAMAGVQQEVTRATHPATRRTGWAPIGPFTLAMGSSLILAVALFMLVFGGSVFGAAPVVYGVALGWGLVGYLLTSVLTGILYGLKRWNAVAFITIMDAVLRASLVVIGLLCGAPLQLLVFFVATPFILAATVTFLVFKSSVLHRFTLDVGLRRLMLHTLGTVGAAAASGLLITGLPMLLGLFSSGLSRSDVAAIILAVTVTRAPIVVPIIALQSYLISAVLRGRESPSRVQVLMLFGCGLAMSAGLAVLGWWVGPWIVGLISAGQYTVAAPMAAAIACSAGLVALQSLTGPVLIVARRHAINAAGWLVAAVLTVALLIASSGSEGVLLAMVVPPLVGLCVHVGAMLRPPRASEYRAA